MQTKNSMLEYVDGKYITADHTDPNNWTYSFNDFCEEYDLEGVKLIDKMIVPLEILDNTLNNGKKGDPSPSDCEKLKTSFETHKIKLDQPPICATIDYKTVNGGTRLTVLPQLGVKCYAVWVVEFDSELDQIDFENKVNDPKRGLFARSNEVRDVEIGVLAWISNVEKKYGVSVSEDELKTKITQYGGNSLTKTEQTSLFRKIKGRDDVAVKPARYKTWTNQTFESWMKGDDFSDPMKDQINDGDVDFYLHNTNNEARWRTFHDYHAKCAKKDVSMNHLAMTPPPSEDGEEDELRKNFYNERERYCKGLDNIFAYKFKHGCYPCQHKDAWLKFAPSSHGEVKDGKLIVLGDVLERLARKAVQEKDN